MIQLSHLNKLRHARAERRGNLLIISIVFVMIVASMGMVMLQMHTSQSRRQLQSTDNKRALYIAEAGLAEAFVAIAQGKSGNVGTALQPAQYADGVYWVEATPGLNDEIGLISIGLCGTGRFALSIVLKRQIDPIASLGFFANQDVTIGKGAVVDGYDSSKGLLVDQLDAALPGATTGSGAMVSASGDIVLEGVADLGGLPKVGLPAGAVGTTLYGDARPGPNGIVSQAADVIVTGSTVPMRQSVTLQAVDPPVAATTTAWRFGAGGGTLPGGEYHFDAAVIAPRGTLRIEGPAVLAFNDLRIMQGAKLQIDSTEGQVVVFVEQYLELAAGSVVDNVVGDPTGFALFANGTEWIDRDGDSLPDPPVVFAPRGEFYGYLYAPAADLTLEADVHFIGGVAANSLTIADGGRLTFDTSLTSSEITVAGLPKLIAWRIVDLPQVDIVKTRRDPFSELDALGVTPTKSSDASADKFVYVKYYDTAKTAHSYSGPYSGFDWSTVSSIIGMMWDDDAVIGDEGQVWTAPATLTKRRIDSGSATRTVR